MQISTFRPAVAIAALVAALLAAAPARAQVKVGDRPNIGLATLDGGRVTSADLAGKLVILEFWATWCGPCIAQLPHLKELNATYADKGVALVSVSIDDAAATARRFAEQNGMTWTQTHGPAVSRQFGVRGIPHAFVLSPDGEVLWSGHPGNLDGKVLDGLLASHPPRPPEPEVTAETLDAATKAIGSARAAIDAKDYPALLAAVAEVPDVTLEHKRIVGQTRVLANKLRLQGDAAALESAKAANPEAAAKLDAMLASVAPKQATATGANATAKSGAGDAASRRLEQADKLREAGDHAGAFKGYTWIVERAGETDAAGAAAERVAEYEADAALMEEIRAAEREEAARGALSMAKGYETAGKPDLAKTEYRRIVADHAGTAAATEAQARLDAMK